MSVFDNGGYIGVTASFGSPFNSSASNIIQDNLILRVDASESESYSGTGATWFDISDNENNGTLTNGPVYNDTYFEFDGDNDFVDFGAITTSNPLQLSSPAGGGATFMFAVNFDGSGDNFQRIIDKSDAGSGANGYSIWAGGAAGNPMGTLAYVINNNGNVASTIQCVAGTWYIIALTHDQSTGNYVWYLNGVSNDTGTLSYSYINIEKNMRIGSWNHDVGRELNGKIGFMLVYEKALNSSEVLQNYNLLKDRYGL